MQNFQNTANGEFWAFNSDVIATVKDGVYSFHSSLGSPLSAPTTLRPSAAPEPAPRQTAIPNLVTAYQFRAALHAMPGKASSSTLLDDINAIIASSPSSLAAIEWEYATTVQRTSDIVDKLMSSSGLTAADIDALFVRADKILG